MYRTLPTLLLLAALAVPASSNELPEMVFKDFPVSEESSREVHKLIARAATLVHPEPRKARQLIVSALEKVDRGRRISEYDYLWSRYGLLRSSFEPDTADFGPGTREDYLRLARSVLAYLEGRDTVADFYFLEDAAFRREVYRTAANGLAWFLYEDAGTDPEALAEALHFAEMAEANMVEAGHHFILDTKVRILLRLGRKEEAFEIVEQVLDEDSDFADFQDFLSNEEFRRWRRTR